MILAQPVLAVFALVSALIGTAPNSAAIAPSAFVSQVGSFAPQVASFAPQLVSAAKLQSNPWRSQSEPPRPIAVTYIWPTNGVIIDPFRPPKNRYGPGNRGLEFATPYGSTFWAAADGMVTFAGQVGGRLHVTVGHPDGLRTSYSGVLTIATDNGIKKGARVQAGDVLGTTDKTLHVGLRRGDTYLDPELFFPPRASPDSNTGNPNTSNPNDQTRQPRGLPRLISTGILPARLVLRL